ncbi:uncharacterized protein MONOS_17925 [Monocercomonoides exilis]|uniref:uncharacterized protein n=1 Tax=Monocercomonoides exilis TaxID=2049356 RepID=UPI0035594E11|nr:hypothetical protein MONOS_17925 [Monocercomonoides exilis]
MEKKVDGKGLGLGPFSGIAFDLCGLPAERRRVIFGENDEEIVEVQRDGGISEGKEEATTQEHSMNDRYPIQLFTYHIQYFFSMTASHEVFSSFSSEISFD